MIDYPNSDIIAYGFIIQYVLIPSERPCTMEKFKNFGDTLTKLRKRKHIKQTELAALLAERGVTLTNQAISKWETGKAIPNAIQFLILCDIYEVDDVLACFSNGQAGGVNRRKDDGREEVLSGLNSDGRKMVTELIQVLSESSRYAQRA